jgi:glycosyltransferase involved in cell wall biosynthesis
MVFKVANLIDTFNSRSGGPPRVVTAIARAGAGVWTAELVTTDFSEAQSDLLLTSDFPGRVRFLDSQALKVPHFLATRLGLPSQLRSVFIEARPDLLHLHGLWSPMLAAGAGLARRAGVPYIVAPHGMLDPWSLGVRRRRKRFALNTYQGRVLAQAAAIHATSEAEADYVRRLDVTTAPIFMIPNTVEEPPHVVAPAAAAPAARSEPKVLLFLSRLHEKKGVGLLLEAWAALRPAQWQLKIVGSGAPAYELELRTLCAAKAIPNVTFHAHAEGAEREALYAGASAFVLPSHTENFGIAIAEAMIRGLPVITTTGTPWKIVASDRLGWYIEPTLVDLTRCLQELFRTDAQTLRDMGVRAREYVRRNLLLEAVQPQLLDMYRRSLHSGTVRQAPASRPQPQ